MAKSLQTVIGVPGRWPDRSDIVTSIASRSGGYLFAGMVMMKIGSKDGFTLVRLYPQRRCWFFNGGNRLSAR
jgi:hypothetical protein